MQTVLCAITDLFGTMQRDRLTEDKRILVRNISCLYRTAKEDISRLHVSMAAKNEQILYLELHKRSPEKAALMKPPQHQPLGNLMPSNPQV